MTQDHGPVLLISFVAIIYVADARAHARDPHQDLVITGAFEFQEFDLQGDRALAQDLGAHLMQVL